MKSFKNYKTGKTVLGCTREEMQTKLCCFHCGHTETEEVWEVELTKYEFDEETGEYTVEDWCGEHVQCPECGEFNHLMDLEYSDENSITLYDVEQEIMNAVEGGIFHALGGSDEMDSVSQDKMRVIAEKMAKGAVGISVKPIDNSDSRKEIDGHLES